MAAASTDTLNISLRPRKLRRVKHTMNISQHTVTGPTPAELDFDPIGCDEPLSLAFRSLVYARGDTVNLRYKVQSAAVSKPPYRKSFRTEDSDLSRPSSLRWRLAQR